MGFTRDSVAKLMEMLDEQSSKSSIDEKTYLELSNAAKYLYEEAGPQTRPETPPPPPEWDDEVLLPSRQNANRNGYITPPRPVARVLTYPDPHRMFSEREITPEYLKRLMNPSLDAYVRERALEREREEYNRVLSTGWSPNADGEDLIAEAQRMASERTA